MAGERGDDDEEEEEEEEEDNVAERDEDEAPREEVTGRGPFSTVVRQIYEEAVSAPGPPPSNAERCKNDSCKRSVQLLVGTGGAIASADGSS